MMEHALTALDRLSDERGQALAEYSLILAFVAAACVIALGALGLAIAGHLDTFAAAIL